MLQMTTVSTAACVVTARPSFAVRVLYSAVSVSACVRLPLNGVSFALVVDIPACSPYRLCVPSSRRYVCMGGWWSGCGQAEEPLLLFVSLLSRYSEGSPRVNPRR